MTTEPLAQEVPGLVWYNLLSQELLLFVSHEGSLVAPVLGWDHFVCGLYT